MIIRVQPLGTDFVGLFLVMAKGKLFYSNYLGSKAFLKAVKGIDVQPVNSETHLLGIFNSGNSKGIVSSMPDMGTVLQTKYTALGNLVAANDNGAVISPLIKGLKGKIEKALGVKAGVSTVAGLDIPGSLILANNKGACVHSEASEEELDKIEGILGVKAHYARLNKSGFLGSMAVANDDVLVLSPTALASEMAHVMEILEID